ncbi:hypothetical protein ACH0CP_18700 [Sphingomonas sp. 179-I 2A4 NHS]|jgi:hypothetical protein|uniref:hypothetical protein n=1 Tax=unclassified Sphingomonas TaxID=196159 RepID=UPI00387A06EA
MARRAVREPRHVPTPKIIGHQPDLFDGPTLTHEAKPVPVCSDRQLRGWMRATTIADIEGGR